MLALLESIALFLNENVLPKKSAPTILALDPHLNELRMERELPICKDFVTLRSSPNLTFLRIENEEPTQK
jgi:hypothetical protein